MRKFFVWILALAFLALSAMAETPRFTPEEYPRVDGSTATLPLSYALMSASTGVSPEEAKQAIQHSKTTEAFYELVDGRRDLLLVYAPSQDAYDYAADNGVELEIEPIGLDALVFLINDGNPITSLTHQQILDIYTGKTTNWKDVGGNDLDIVAYQRVENSGSQVMMRAQVMQGTQMADAPTELRPGLMDELVNEIASYRNTENAIGYSVYYYVHNMYIQDSIKLLEINGVAPSNETIASGEYPYGQEFYAVIRKDAPENAPERLLFQWLVTPEGQALVESAGYVPVGTDSAA